MKEAYIVINGNKLLPAHAMTIRVALNSFAMDLHEDGLGDDDTGKATADAYLTRINEILAIMELG